MRIILSKEDIKGERAIISGEKAKYLISVLRCVIGDSLQVLDGEGNAYDSKIVDIENKKVIAAISEKLQYDTESPLNLILIQGLLKADKMDWVIQKTTELGVKEIIPAITDRSQVRHTRKVDRWRKIAEEASRQSGRTMIPAIHDPVEFGNFLRTISNPPIPPFPLQRIRPGAEEKVVERGLKGKSESPNICGLIFYEEGGLALKETVEVLRRSVINSEVLTTNSELFIAIGPEGGFTKRESGLANSKGLLTVSLGKRILRAETAAIAAAALIQFLMGDIYQS